MTTARPANPPPPPPPRTGLPRWAIALIVAVTALVIGAGVFVALTVIGGTASAAEVTREPVNTAGANPFMPAVGTDAPDVAPPTTNGGTFRGDTPGLYGGTRDDRTCDAAKMTDFLRSHPSEAAAWAGVLDIRTTEIDSFVSTLTPVLLRSDTRVTNHGYVDGRVTVVHSVLQAGTAVFVDR
ncbi:MAG: LCCL domain protein, partial [Actinomycetota bacterium]|nr:LCCL domain protein [Actinomycetota bacterium]